MTHSRLSGDRKGDGYRARLSVAVVSGHEVLPPGLSRDDARLVRGPGEIRGNDDVVLFHGANMAHTLQRFSAALQGGLPPAVILAPRLDWNDVHRALDNGVRSYLLENRYAFLLGEAVRCAARGTSILDPAIAAECVRAASLERGRAHPPTASAVPRGGEGSEPSPEAVGRYDASLSMLSPQERQIMALLASGLTIGEIAREMCLTERTVRNYLSRIYRKLNARGQTEAVLRWLGHLS